MKSAELVRATTSDGLYLHGFFAPQPGKKALLHIHGFQGNFYENYFVQILAHKLRDASMTFLSANTRGNGTETFFATTDGSYRRVGAHFELLEAAFEDINAWVDFLLQRGYEEIILQGHSLGTIKVVRYLFEGEYPIHKLILLAPFDKTAEIEKVTGGKWPEYVALAQKKVTEGKGEDIVPGTFGKEGMSYQTYASWYQAGELSHLFDFSRSGYTFPALQKITVPTKIIVGTQDEHFHPTHPDHPEEALQLLLQHIPQSEGKLIDGAVHSYAPHEDKMSDEVVEFVTP